jgi:hypothetical protein
MLKEIGADLTIVGENPLHNLRAYFVSLPTGRGSDKAFNVNLVGIEKKARK